MRLALNAGLVPRRHAVGAAAALRFWQRDAEPAALRALWREAPADPAEMQTILDLVAEGRDILDGWRLAGFPDLEKWIGTQMHS
jgi:hypothetical protein